MCVCFWFSKCIIYDLCRPSEEDSAIHMVSDVNITWMFSQRPAFFAQVFGKVSGKFTLKEPWQECAQEMTGFIISVNEECKGQCSTKRLSIRLTRAATPQWMSHGHCQWNMLRYALLVMPLLGVFTNDVKWPYITISNQPIIFFQSPWVSSQVQSAFNEISLPWGWVWCDRRRHAS